MVNPPGAPGVPRPDGLIVAPFRALRYDPDVVTLASVIAPPYDVIDDGERRDLEDRDPHNVVRLTLPQDEGSSARYDVAAERLARWRSKGVLRPDAEPALYVYELETPDGHRQRGLVGALGLTPAEDGIVLPHENTMAGPVNDRLALLAATQADLEAIFLVYDGGGAASELVEAAENLPLLSDVVAKDGVTHRVWSLTDRSALHDVATDLSTRRAVIADGHHRYATFLRHQADRHAAGDGNGPWDRGLAFLVDGTTFGPTVHAIHRAVPSLAAPIAVERAGSAFRVTPIEHRDAESALERAGGGGPAFVVADGERAWLLDQPDPRAIAEALPADRSAAWRSLDVAVAHGYLIATVWGLPDTEDVVEFHHDVPAAIESARASGGLALLLNPTPVSDVAAVAAAGERMPRKSTLFTPKPATGLLIRSFADA